MFLEVGLEIFVLGFVPFFGYLSNGASKGVLGNSLEFSQVLALFCGLADFGHHQR